MGFKTSHQGNLKNLPELSLLVYAFFKKLSIVINYFSKMCGFVLCVWNTKVKGLRSLQAGGLSFLLFQSQLDFGQRFVVEAEPSSPPLLIS